MAPREEASNPSEEREELVEEATNSMMANWPGTSGYLDALEVTGEEAAELRALVASLPPLPPPQEIYGFQDHFEEDLTNSDSEEDGEILTTSGAIQDTLTPSPFTTGAIHSLQTQVLIMALMASRFQHQ